MQTILIEKILDAKIESVFAGLSDHEGYSDFPGIDRVKLLQQGEHEKNGLGAVREIKAGPLRLVEDITRFERPKIMEYKITRSTLPIDHELGQIKLIEEGERTRVEWTSRFSIPIPLIGRLLEKVFKKQFSAGFASTLKEIEKRCHTGKL